MSLQHEIWLKRAGVLKESIQQLDEDWEQLISESMQFDGSDINYFIGLQEEISDLLEALPKAAYVSAMRSATDPMGSSSANPDKIVARAAKHHGEKFAKDLDSGSTKMHYPRAGHTSGYDPLKSRSPSRVTQAGKANKQDVSALKSRLKGR
jgi:hypothetical protein